MCVNDGLGACAAPAGVVNSRRLALTCVAVMLAAVIIDAATRTRTATATATINALAKLTFSTTSIAFPDADPDSVPNIAQTGSPLTITAKARTTIGSAVNLSVAASGDLRSGLNLIPVSQLRWTATGTGFAAGTMSASTPQTVGTWTSSGSRSGTQSYYLINSWSYAAGTYTTTLTYTLSAP